MDILYIKICLNNFKSLFHLNRNKRNIAKEKIIPFRKNFNWMK